MEPVIVHRKDDGTVHVLMGQRRTRAAVEAQRIGIPVMIIEAPEEDLALARNPKAHLRRPRPR